MSACLECHHSPQEHEDTADAFCTKCDCSGLHLANHLTPEAGSRGFLRLPPISSVYGGEVEVYESSMASGPHIWLKATCPDNLNDPQGKQVEAVAHLTIEDAAKLAQQINYLIDNHYQVTSTTTIR